MSADIYPDGTLRVFGEILGEITTKNDIKIYKDLFKKLNANNVSLNSIVNELKNDNYLHLLISSYELVIGCDYLPLYLQIYNNDKDTFNVLLNRKEKICFDLTINGAINRLTFRWDELQQDQSFGYYIDLITELDSTEVNNYFSYTCTGDTTRSIEIYLRKECRYQIEEINLDPTTEPKRCYNFGH